MTAITNGTQPAQQPEPCSPAEFSDQAFVYWARMDDGSWCFAIIDPTPPEEDA